MVLAAQPRAGEKVERARAINLARQLLEWYDQHHRQLPWRSTNDPYATWVSEVMLQQTQVVTVIPYFERWMRRFPTIRKLANAPEQDVLVAWQGLGYYSRARNLQRAAQELERNFKGALPADPTVLQQLPGIGRYTAGAIASIAFNRPHPAVDGNVMRVITRLQALRGDPRVSPLSEAIWEIAAEWVQCDRPSAFNQALMELGALVCVPEQPRCGNCPLVRSCHAHQRELTTTLPELRKRKQPEQRYVTVLVSKQRDALLLLKQPTSAPHWATLDVLPHAEHNADETAEAAAAALLKQLDPSARLIAREPLTELSYPITRFRFKARVFETSTLRQVRLRTCAGRYVPLNRLAEAAIPAPHRRICDQLLRQTTKDPAPALPTKAAKARNRKLSRG